MARTAYVETSVISYLAADSSTNVIVAGNQAVTREWWARRADFDLYISQLVLQEAGRGNPTQAAKRVELVNHIPVLAMSDTAESVAAALLAGGPPPAQAEADALHIALAAANGIEFLVTWNCRHIANAVMRPAINEILLDNGLEPPIICTPQELQSG